MSATPHARTTTASYEAEPSEVRRVLLLYSGGLDTSVMLKWIQDEYEAEVVALTINLGQPGEDYDVVRGKALQLGALDCHVVDAREEFVREYVTPAIKANADYGDGYPLFTALGRPLIAKLAVEYARRTGCDTIAHGCTGKGNDQVRIEATVAALDPDLRVIAPVREWHFPSAQVEAEAPDVGALRERLGLSAEEPVILYSGTFEAYQGLPELIAAIPLVRAQVPSATFVLVGASLSSRSARTAIVARKKKHSLWVNGEGNFQTRGKRASAILRGTYFLTEETTQGTLFVVKRGAVAVRDFGTKRTTVVRQGHSYLARTPAHLSAPRFTG